MRTITFEEWQRDGHAEVRFVKEGVHGGEMIGDICYMFQEWVEEKGYGVWDNGGELWSEEIFKECGQAYEEPEEGELMYALYDDEGNEMLLAFRGEVEGEAFTVEKLRVLPRKEREEVRISSGL